MLTHSIVWSERNRNKDGAGRVARAVYIFDDCLRSVSEQFPHRRKQTAFRGGDFGVAHHELRKSAGDAVPFRISAELSRQTHGMLPRCFGVPDIRADASHRRIKFAVAIILGGKAHCPKDALQARVFDRGQMTIHIHGEHKQVEKSAPLAGAQSRKRIVIVHGPRMQRGTKYCDLFLAFASKPDWACNSLLICAMVPLQSRQPSG
jgi:hypothetical protein